MHSPAVTIERYASFVIARLVQITSSNHPISGDETTKWADQPSLNQTTRYGINHGPPLFSEIVDFFGFFIHAFKPKQVATSWWLSSARTRHAMAWHAKLTRCRADGWGCSPVHRPHPLKDHSSAASCPIALACQSCMRVLAVLTWCYILQVLQTIIFRVAIHMMDLPCVHRFWKAIERDHNHAMNWPVLAKKIWVSIPRRMTSAIADKAIQTTKASQGTHTPRLGSVGSCEATEGSCEWVMQVQARDHEAKDLSNRIEAIESC